MMENENMVSKIILPKQICELEAVRYIARRYKTTPEKVLVHYLVQDGIITPSDKNYENTYNLEPNEIALFRDLGVKPTQIEIK